MKTNPILGPTTDMFGHILKVGDAVAYPVRRGSNLDVHFGVIVQVNAGIDNGGPSIKVLTTAAGGMLSNLVTARIVRLDRVIKLLTDGVVFHASEETADRCRQIKYLKEEVDFLHRPLTSIS